MATKLKIPKIKLKAPSYFKKDQPMINLIKGTLGLVVFTSLIPLLKQ